jgi:hypothetical protein
MNSERGQALIWVVLIMALGSLVITGLLSYVSASLRADKFARERTGARYTAEAGAEAVLLDLLGGVDALSPGYTVPSVSLNGYSAAISISAPDSQPSPPARYWYFDPGAGTGLSPLAGGAHWQFQVNNIRAGSDIQVNWVFTPAAAKWKLTLYKDGAEVAAAQGTRSPGVLVVSGSAIQGGSYTFDFHNADSVATAAAPFSAKGGTNNTWIWATAYQDYLITSTAGKVTLKVYARQYPGPTTPTTSQYVSIESWQN